MAEHSYKSLMSRLAKAGFKGGFARVAVLPEWWDASCETDDRLLNDIEIRVARFLGAPLSLVRDPSAPLLAPIYAGAQLRRVRDINRDRLWPAIHTALNIGAAVVRSSALPELRLPPADPIAWREAIVRQSTLTLDDLVADSWERGIPVVHVDELPAPSFQGIASIVEGRPVVLLCHDLDEPGRLAFIIGHEFGHIVNGDCAPGQPVVDEEEAISDDAEVERRADAFSISLLTGGVQIPSIEASDFKDLAQQAISIEATTGVDAAAVISSWARRSDNYRMATMAAKALYRHRGGQRVIRKYLDRYLTLDSASDSDRALLRCLSGDPERDAAAAD